MIQNEIKFRGEKGLPVGFKLLEKSKPLVAVGADGPLDGRAKSADYFHGRDGLAGIYSKHQHLLPQEAWEHLFDEPPKDSTIAAEAKTATHSNVAVAPLFKPSSRPAHLEMLSILAANPPDTVDIIAIGPLTTVALAAAADPKTFLKVKSVIIMGGAIEKAGNITPLAEFNIYADAVAAARVFALTSAIPSSTMPPQNNADQSYPPVVDLGDRRLNIVLFPLDITEQHPVPRGKYLDFTKSMIDAGSPLATFGTYLFDTTYNKLESLTHGITGFTLHDPLCVWYALDAARNPSQWKLSPADDIRIETVGQWSQGACIVDRRRRKEMAESDEVGEEEEVIGDTGGWLGRKRRNRVRVCTITPGWESFADLMLKSVYG